MPLVLPMNHLLCIGSYNRTPCTPLKNSMAVKETVA